MVTYWQAVGENLMLALDTLRTHKFRSFLTVLGVLIGTTTVIAVASIIAGLDAQLVRDGRTVWDARLICVYKLQMGAPHRLTREERLRKPLSYEDAQAIGTNARMVEAVSVDPLPGHGRVRPAALHRPLQGPGDGGRAVSGRDHANYLAS